MNEGNIGPAVGLMLLVVFAMVFAMGFITGADRADSQLGKAAVERGYAVWVENGWEWKDE